MLRHLAYEREMSFQILRAISIKAFTESSFYGPSGQCPAPLILILFGELACLSNIHWSLWPTSHGRECNLLTNDMTSPRIYARV
jgi:hypothetical protein